MPTYVSYDGAELAYQELGSGAPLLVIPGRAGPRRGVPRGPARPGRRDPAQAGRPGPAGNRGVTARHRPDVPPGRPDRRRRGHARRPPADRPGRHPRALRRRQRRVAARRAEARRGLPAGAGHSRDPCRRAGCGGRRLGRRTRAAGARALVRRAPGRARGRGADARARDRERGLVLRALGRWRPRPCGVRRASAQRRRDRVVPRRRLRAGRRGRPSQGSPYPCGSCAASSTPGPTPAAARSSRPCSRTPRSRCCPGPATSPGSTTHAAYARAVSTALRS